MRKQFLQLVIGLFIIPALSYCQSVIDTTSIQWKEGYLDIHHILTGSGDCAFFVFPDGTTMILDAGDIGERSLRRSAPPLTPTPPYPDNSKTAAGWIVDYISQVFPEKSKPVIDYALITHYHDDHMGGITTATKTSKDGSYKLTGITEVGTLMPIKKLIDRNFPANDYPINLSKFYQKEPSIFLNLQKFIRYQQSSNGMQAEQLQVGSVNQITLKNEVAKYPGFFVRGVKANGTIWTGKGTDTFEYLKRDSIVSADGSFNENPLSLAIKVTYGKFDYFGGGDNTGLGGTGVPSWFDVETPISKAVGKVEVTTLCHHGCRDAVNENFLSALQPQTVVHQAWSTNHPGEEVLHRLINKAIYPAERNIFGTNIQESTKQAIGFWLTENYQSTFGHIIIRVLPGGDQYYVLIAETVEGKVEVKKVFGPYLSK